MPNFSSITDGAYATPETFNAPMLELSDAIDSVRSDATANFLPLSGKTLTGNLVFETGTGEKRIHGSNTTGFMRFAGGSASTLGGQVRAFGSAQASFPGAVDILTPNAAGVDSTRIRFASGSTFPQITWGNGFRRTDLAGGYSDFQYVDLIHVSLNTNGADFVSGHRSRVSYVIPETTSGFNNRWHGMKSEIFYGSATTNAMGSVHNFTADLSVRGSTNSANEHANLVGYVQYDAGTNGRAWLTDTAIHGPVGSQINSAAGYVMFMGNYYNGAMASAMSAAAFVAAIIPGTGTASDATHSAATMYKVDYGFQVTGYAGRPGTRTRGWEVGFRAGGTGGHWNNPLDAALVSTGASSILGTGFEGSDFEEYGVRIHTPRNSTSTAISVSGGTYVVGLDLSTATYTAGAIKLPSTATLYAAAAQAIAVDNNAGAGNTRFFVYDVDNGTLERVTVGIADSGGAGFKLLRIPN